MRTLSTPSDVVAWLRTQVRGTLHTDSRSVGPGDGFIAWPGAASDRRAFVPAALQAGASACVVEAQGADAFTLDLAQVIACEHLKAATGPIAAAYFDHPSAQLQVLAVTGTNGKTSVSWWLAQALSALPEARGLACGLIGTLGVGRPPADVQPTGFTTPDPVIVHKTLRGFADAGLGACAMEASSIGIEEGRLDGVQVRVAIFTNFTQDHLDYHGSMQAYWQAKARLFAWPGLRAAVLNVDDPKGAELAQQLSQRPAEQGPLDVWTVSCGSDARLRARAIDYSGTGMRFEVCEGTEVHSLQTRLIGSYNVSNLLCVLATLRSLGVPLTEAVQACSQLSPVPGRMECLGGAPGQPLVAIDYAHTPDALEQALRALRPMAEQRQGRLWCVFGCGGDRDPGKRPLMGAIAQRLADVVLVTSDNPRSEAPQDIVTQILQGLSSDRGVSVQLDRAQAIAQAIARAGARDVLLLAGKGHEQTQEVAGQKWPFADQDHALRALQQRPREECPA
jgi:UDP-N-acetylmuramyl-tripeptide synthetase